MWRLLRQTNPYFRRRDLIFKHIHGLGKKENVVILLEAAQNQELLRWRRPAATHYT
jgi:hypothetical protein